MSWQPRVDASARSGWGRTFPALLAALFLACALLWQELPRRGQEGPPSYPPAAHRLPRSESPPAEGAACAACHAEIVAAWSASQHALANRLIQDVRLQPGEIQWENTRTRIDADLTLRQSGSHAFEGKPVAVIGVEPLFQLLVETERGQWQAFNPAYHPADGSWFNVFTDDRGPSEWGHWSKRAMNWNSQCAWCHMTGFEKRYNPETDAYDSRWQAMGIACAQCHGDLSAHAADPVAAPARRKSPAAAMDNCLSCHARREFLTPESFKAGDRFDDHFRLTLLDTPGTFHADGQIQDEVFEGTSFLSSRMGHRGIRCLDCHDPHSGKTILPTENNALCMSCHTAPGRQGATPVDPVAHGRHAEGSAGNSCIGCHMPATTYMQKDPRRDHGFHVPDPLLSREIGSPNACAACHADRSADWIVEKAEAWYGEKLSARPDRERARAIARAWAGDPDAGDRLLAVAVREENVVWRASLLRLLGPHADRPGVEAHLRQALGDTNALVRAAAIHALAAHPAAGPWIGPLREDAVREVRIDATLATLAGETDLPLPEEIRDYLAFNADQPSGALRQAEVALRLHRKDEAARWAKRLLAYDPSSEPQHVAGRILHAAGRTDEALAALRQATAMDPGNAGAWYSLALLEGEAGTPAAAARALGEVVRLDPAHGRAWYNLGLLHARAGDTDEAIRHLRRAEAEMPASADPAYALATVFLNKQRIAEGREALVRALARQPGHAPSLRLLRQLQPPAP